jgi:predicted enzyme related to lactoylglutathione lyase
MEVVGLSTDVKTLVGKFVWHDNSSTDVEKAKAFYNELFGWELEVWKPGEMDYAMVKANGQMHGGFGAAQGGAPSPRAARSSPGRWTSRRSGGWR